VIEGAISLAAEAPASMLGSLGFDGLAKRFEKKPDPRNFPPPR
jgi:hypothetical protein